MDYNVIIQMTDFNRNPSLRREKTTRFN